MTNKNNQIIVAFFGASIKKEPFLIDTDTSIGQEVAALEEEEKPQVLLNSLNETVFGQTFNKILPEIEPYLKVVFDNQNSKKRSEAAILLAVENLDLKISKKTLSSGALQDQVNSKINSKNNSKNNLKIEDSPQNSKPSIASNRKVRPTPPKPLGL